MKLIRRKSSHHSSMARSYSKKELKTIWDVDGEFQISLIMRATLCQCFRRCSSVYNVCSKSIST